MTEQSASILVVDDTVENLRLLATMLADHGLEARPVRSGWEALEAARLDPPDLILLDITMPEIDGYETCTRLKAIPALADIPILFITALGELADKVKAFEVGGADYITKPFQIEEVMARVRVHLALRRANVDLARNYERLRALEELREDLVQMMVHDMRSPLTVLMANLHFLRTDVGNTIAGESLEDLESAAKAADVVNRMANDLLDVSRMEEGKFPLTRSQTNLVDVASSVCSSLTGWQRGRSIDVQSTGAVEVMCDGAVIRRVIENLVSNAIKHTPETGRIQISLVAGSAPRIEVLDEGPGVPVEARGMIFDKFGTLAARQNRAYHSSGLGLAFCKLAVEAHGGRIGIDDREGAGSNFWFDLPVVEPATA